MPVIGGLQPGHFIAGWISEFTALVQHFTTGQSESTVSILKSATI